MPDIFLKHGAARLRPFPDYATASAYYCAKRDKSGKGASQFPPALLYTSEGHLLGHVSYNSRVWPGLPQSWQPGAVPLFTP